MVKRNRRKPRWEEAGPPIFVGAYSMDGDDDDNADGVHLVEEGLTTRIMVSDGPSTTGPLFNDDSSSNDEQDNASASKTNKYKKDEEDDSPINTTIEGLDDLSDISDEEGNELVLITSTVLATAGRQDPLYGGDFDSRREAAPERATNVRNEKKLSKRMKLIFMILFALLVIMVIGISIAAVVKQKTDNNETTENNSAFKQDGSPISFESDSPASVPSWMPSTSDMPSDQPSAIPSISPTNYPTVEPTLAPTGEPTLAPTREPTMAPTRKPTLAPTSFPTAPPTTAPSSTPSLLPSSYPTDSPSQVPSSAPIEVVPEFNLTASDLLNETAVIVIGSTTAEPSRTISSSPEVAGVPSTGLVPSLSPTNSSPMESAPPSVSPTKVPNPFEVSVFTDILILPAAESPAGHQDDGN